MFKPAPMMRLTVVVLEKDERPALRELASLGAVQLTAGASEEILNLAARSSTEELARCDRILARIADLTRSFGDAYAEPPAAMSCMSFDEAEPRLRFWEEQAGALVRRREGLQRKLQASAETTAQLAEFRALDVPLETRSEFLHFVTGSLPVGALQKIKSQGDLLLLPLPAIKGRQPVIAATNVSGKAGLDEMLRRADFRRQDLPELPNGTVSEAFLDAQNRQTDTLEELNLLEAQFKSLVKRAAEPLASIRDSIRSERILLQAQGLFARSESSVLITGWIPTTMASGVRERLMQCTEDRSIIEILQPAGYAPGEMPVLLEHSRLLRPFEWLVKAYGLPRYNEIAPTFFVAVSFVLMFGMMFGDVGHGALLALAGAVLLFAVRTRNLRDIGVLLIFNGLASVGFGIAYGSYFGLPSMKQHALWHDPLEGDPIRLMRLAIAIGVVLMSTGILLNILNRLRHREFVEGVFDKFGIAGMIFYWGALVMLMKWAVIQARGWGPAMILAVAISIVCWTLKEPILFFVRRMSGKNSASEGVLSALIESLVGAFEGVLLYVANTISFVRLAAYAMAHAALLMAAFTLAAHLHRPSAGGTALSVSVIVLGNLLAISLEGIIAAVQGLRLEYYEFFGKFFSGEGQAFKPFALSPDSTFSPPLNPRGVR